MYRLKNKSDFYTLCLFLMIFIPSILVCFTTVYKRSIYKNQNENNTPHIQYVLKSMHDFCRVNIDYSPKIAGFPNTMAMLSSGYLVKDSELLPYAGASGWEEDKQKRLEWFKNAKFGMFIHFGLYSSAGGYWPPNPQTGKRYSQDYAEWIRNWANVPEPEYGDLTRPLFLPEKRCTEHWAKVAQEAGMKYAVLTTKHHDGYTLFNSKTSYSIDNPITGSTNISPKGRDLVEEYAHSMRNVGIKVGFYYSLIDWQHPDAYKLSRRWPLKKFYNHSNYLDYIYAHLNQLFTDYGKIDVLWVDYSDSKYQGSKWRTQKILTAAREMQPHIITNNRFWNGLQNSNGDFFTPEKYIPSTGFANRSFEVCHTLNESFGFSYHDKNWKSSEEIIHLLVDVVSKGGNLLLNVGPDAKGYIPKEAVKSLQETGKWLQINGDSIYGTSASPFIQLAFNGRCTQKKDFNGNTHLFFHIFKLPATGKIQLDGIQNKILSVQLLNSLEEVKFDQSSDTIRITLPKKVSTLVCPVVEVIVKGIVDIKSSIHTK